VAKNPVSIQTATALRGRLLAVADEVAGFAVQAEELPTMGLLSVLAAAVRADLDKPRFWLLMCGVAGAMPNRDEFMRAFRVLELAESGREHYAVLEACAGMANANDYFARQFRVLVSSVVVDVNFSARHGHNTGIQRVVRETVTRWSSRHDIELVAWTKDAQTMRSLVPEERRRVVEWNSTRKLEASPALVEDAAELVIPWKCTIVVPEVSQLEVCAPLACLAEFSGNHVVLVGHDAIPVLSAEYVVPSESDRFVRYLSIVKHADVVVGTCKSSSEEFAGFAAALSAQRLSGPDIQTVYLPVALSAREENAENEDARTSDAPLVICVGTQEPRKNQLAVLAAAEMLWTEGLNFELLFIGAAAMPLSIPFDVEVARLQKARRAVRVERLVTDAGLERAYHEARFSVFVSLHEGFGLPVGESLAAGTPVVTTNFGSTAEIAEGGGCVLVDPRSDESIAGGMRRLLLDDALVERLAREARDRPNRTWDDYATELWDVVEKLQVPA
jgi:glycosyltransferase involved in cell wall biosynthesis